MKKSFLLSGALLLSISAFTANAQQIPVSNLDFTSWKGTCGTSTWTSTMYSKVAILRDLEMSRLNGMGRVLLRLE